MVMLNEGLQDIASYLSTEIDRAQLGTGTTAASPNDTDLISAVAASKLSVTTSIVDKQLTIDYNLSSATATGNVFTEFTTLNNASSTNFNRIVFTGVSHTTNTEINVKQRFFIRGI